MDALIKRVYFISEDEMGITVSEMDAYVNTTRRLNQEFLHIQADNTLRLLNTLIAERRGRVLLDALEVTRTGEDYPVRISVQEESCCSVPRRVDVQEFRRRGNRFY